MSISPTSPRRQEASSSAPVESRPSHIEKERAAAANKIDQGPSSSSPLDLSSLISGLSIDDQRKIAALFQKNIAIEDESTITDAIHQGREAVLALLRENKVDPSSGQNKLICWAARSGDEEIVKLLLLDRRVDPGVDENKPLEDALFYRHTAVARLLVADPRVNPTSYDATQWACKNGPEDVKLLLANPNYATLDRLATWACVENQPGILALLLVHPRFELRDGNVILNTASRLGHLEIVQLLVTNPRFNLAANEGEAFKLACGSGHAQCVQTLIANGVDPALDNNYGIIYAANGEVARLLLVQPSVDPTAEHSRSLLFASIHGKLDVVQELLKDGRADPTVDMGACLVWAHSKGHEGVVAALMLDPRVNPNRRIRYEDWHDDPTRLSFSISPFLAMGVSE